MWRRLFSKQFVFEHVDAVIVGSTFFRVDERDRRALNTSAFRLKRTPEARLGSG
jgi:hypothetical protein